MSELRVSLTDFAKTKPDKGALLRFDFASPGLPDALASPVPTGSGASATLSPAPSVDSSKGQVLIEARNSPYPFTLNVVFRQYCMFRHEIDRTDRTERYYKKGDQITANANNGIEIWCSNATACTIQVIAGGQTVAVNMGKAGEVVVKNIKWIQTDSGWALTALPVD
jgi:cytoskeletal protein RodZ